MAKVIRKYDFKNQQIVSVSLGDDLGIVDVYGNVVEYDVENHFISVFLDGELTFQTAPYVMKCFEICDVPEDEDEKE